MLLDYGTAQEVLEFPILSTTPLVSVEESHFLNEFVEISPELLGYVLITEHLSRSSTDL